MNNMYGEKVQSRQPNRAARAFHALGVLVFLGWAVAATEIPALATPGDLFVSNGASSTNSVSEYDRTTGAFVTTFASGFPLIGDQLGLVFGPNGNLFVSTLSQVVEYDGRRGRLCRPSTYSG